MTLVKTASVTCPKKVFERMTKRKVNTNCACTELSAATMQLRFQLNKYEIILSELSLGRIEQQVITEQCSAMTELKRK